MATLPAFLLLTFCAGALASPSAEAYSLTYGYPTSDETATVDIVVDDAQNTIRFGLEHETEHFPAVETLEDYATGFAATKDFHESRCTIRKIGYTLEEQKSFIKFNQGRVLTMTSKKNVVTYPRDAIEEFDIGSRLEEFCADLEQVVASEKEEERSEDTALQAEDRCFFFFQFLGGFTGCTFFLLLPVCYTTTLTLPTGTTLILFPFIFFLG